MDLCGDRLYLRSGAGAYQHGDRPVGRGGPAVLFPANGIILLVMAFLISPYGLPMAAIWLLGKVQDLKFAIQDLVYG